MEEEKAAAYYDELTRKGEGAARFKQGLGFSLSSSASEDDAVPARGAALPSSSSSFLSQFVRASSPNSTAKFKKESELRSIRNKLKKKPDDQMPVRVSERSHRDLNKRESRGGRCSPSTERDDRERIHRRRSRSIERHDKEKRHRRRSRSRSREGGNRERHHRRRSKSKDKHRDGERERDRYRDRERDRYRDRDQRSENEKRERRREGEKMEKNGKVDYSRLIKGYDQMSTAERVKAKMKLQLAETAEKDTMSAGWERFEFDKDALVDDEEIEATDDDADLVKQIGQSFRFSAIEARREEQIKAAHDEAMFGAPARLLAATPEDNLETDSTKKDSDETNAATSLLSDKVLAKQQGCWRDRARKA